MKKFMALIVLATVTTLTQATEGTWFKSHKPVDCGPFREIVEMITGNEFRERVTWLGNSHQDHTKFVLFRNPDTNTWTVIQYGQDIACVLGMGSGDNTFENISNQFKM